MAIYGANAAGKSNVIHALLLMREMVCGSFAKPLKGDELPYEPFAFVDGETDPTAFEIIYYYDGIKYAYGFSFDNDRIINEYLYHWPNGREALVFSREKDQYEFRESIQEQLTLAGQHHIGIVVPCHNQVMGIMCDARCNGSAFQAEVS